MEQNIRNLVVGYDFSPAARHALEAAASLADRLGAGLVVATSIHGALDDRILSQLEADTAEGHEKLESRAVLYERVQSLVRESVGALDTRGVALRFDVGEAPPVDHLTQAASNGEGDVICVGTVGNYEPPPGHLVGLDAERLARRSVLPVLVVHPRSPFPPETILVPVDFSDASERAFGQALDFARLYGSKLVALHVVDIGASRVQSLVGAFRPKGYAEAAVALGGDELDAFIARFELGDVRIERLVVEGRPATVVVDTARDRAADLICIGAVGRNAFVDSLVGGTTSRVLAQAPCSVMAVKPDAYALRS